MQVKIEMLGSADRIVVMKEQTTIVSDGRNTEAVEARIKTIRKEVEDSDSAVSYLPSRALSFWCVVPLSSVNLDGFVKAQRALPLRKDEGGGARCPKRCRPLALQEACFVVVFGTLGSFVCTICVSVSLSASFESCVHIYHCQSQSFPFPLFVCFGPALSRCSSTRRRRTSAWLPWAGVSLASRYGNILKREKTNRCARSLKVARKGADLCWCWHRRRSYTNSARTTSIHSRRNRSQN